MIPTAYDEADYTAQAAQPSKTYCITKDGHIRGWRDGKDALKQAIYCAVMTQRYDHAIYSHNYGLDKRSLLGETMPLVYTKIRDKITDALMRDDRIVGVGDFSFSSAVRGTVLVTFTVTSNLGKMTTEATVDV